MLRGILGGGETAPSEHLPFSNVNAAGLVPAAGEEAPGMLSDQQVLDLMQTNARIPIANGFVLAPDYRPAGRENEYIPDDLFTWYFWQGIAPYASSGAHQRHDRRHGPSYNSLFQSPSFAGSVREAAGVSYVRGCSYYFTRAMDQLGDSHVLLTTCQKPDAAKDYEHVLDARLQLQRLLHLRGGTYTIPDRPLHWQQQQLFSSIWHETDFALLEHRVELELKALPKDEQAAILQL